MNLRHALAQRQLADVQRELAGVRKQLGLTVEALHRARKAKPVHVVTGRRRARLKGDRIRVIIPDTHGAKVHRGALAATLADIKFLAPHEVILLGDHVDCGGFLAQHHTLGYVAETDYTYEDDIAHAAAFLDALQAAAPAAAIDYLEGNHERRVETWCVTVTLKTKADAEKLRRAFAPEFLLDLAGRGIPYRRLTECYDGLNVQGIIRRGKCFFFHGISTAKNAAATTQVRVAGNCVFGHTHRAQSDTTRRLGTGIVGAWNPGCLCELQPLWNHGRPTDWTHGYAVQLVAPSGAFLHLNVPVIGGKSLLTSLFKT